MVNISTRVSSTDVHNLDLVIKKKRFLNRSDAVRDYIRRGVREDLGGSEYSEKEQAFDIGNGVSID